MTVPALSITLLFAAAPAGAAEDDRVVREPDREAYARKTLINFSEVQIGGEVVKPEGSYLSTRRRTKFRSLIRLRADFLPELVASTDAL